MKIGSKMLSRFTEIDKELWRFRQPLTRKPVNPVSVVSDLFVWRKSYGWRTFFYLTDIGSLFGPQTKTRTVKICVFDQRGALVGMSSLDVDCYSRRQIDISEIADGCIDDSGTFCVLHPETPDVISKLGSNLAERGYVSYCYGEASVKSCVHGNLDAVGMSPSGEIELLTGTSFLTRKYRLQYDLKRGNLYELAIVNASASSQNVQCELFSTRVEMRATKRESKLKLITPESRYLRLCATLRPGACHIFRVNPSDSQGASIRAVLRSRLVMLRPIVFEMDGGRINVFHG